MNNYDNLSTRNIFKMSAQLENPRREMTIEPEQMADLAKYGDKLKRWVKTDLSNL